MLDVVRGVGGVIHKVVDAAGHVAVAVDAVAHAKEQANQHQPYRGAPGKQRDDGDQDGNVEDDRIAARGDKLGVQTQAEELFEVLPHAVHLLGEVGLFARLFVDGLRGDHLGRGLVDRRGLGGGVRRCGLRLALRLEPNDGVQNVAVGSVERRLGVGVAHIALGADGFNFFEVVHDLSLRSMGATPGDLPGRERSVRRPVWRRPALVRTL